jgi:hypothetical protein
MIARLTWQTTALPVYVLLWLSGAAFAACHAVSACDEVFANKPDWNNSLASQEP